MKNKSDFFNYISSKDNCQQFLFKIGTSDFLRVNVNAATQELTARRVRKDKDGKRIAFGAKIDGFEELYSIVKDYEVPIIEDGQTVGYKKADGAFFACRDFLADGGLKEHQREADTVVVEIDDLSIEDQLAKYAEFERISGLSFSKISSGGKSIHAHLSTYRTDIDYIMYLNQLLILALDADPALARPHQPFRIPGFFRSTKGNHQDLLAVGGLYSYGQIFLGIKKYYEFLGLEMPTKIDLVYWQKITSVLNSDKGNAARKALPVTKEEKQVELKALLEQGNDNFVTKKHKEVKQKERQRKEYQATFGGDDQDKQELIRQIVKVLPIREKGTGTYEMYRSIGTAIKNELGLETAVGYMSELAPTGEDWESMLISSTGSYSIGTLIYYGREYGFTFDRESTSHQGVTLSGEAAIEECKKRVARRNESAFYRSQLEKTLEQLKHGFSTTNN